MCSAEKKQIGFPGFPAAKRESKKLNLILTKGLFSYEMNIACIGRPLMPYVCGEKGPQKSVKIFVGEIEAKFPTL